MAEVLPPLSDWDNTRLCVILPVLSVLFASDHTFEEDALCPLVPSLVEYVLTREYHKSARASASSCIFSIVSKHLRDENKCTIDKIMSDKLCPLMISSLTKISNDSSSFYGITELQDVMNLTALIGSAAICGGGSLSSVGNDIVRLLTLISCQDNAEIITGGFFRALNFGDICEKNKVTISMIASNAFGAILSVETGNPFWKQRISHIVLPTLLSSSETSPNIKQGRLLCIGHLVCCVPLRALGEKRRLDLVSIIIDGLEICVSFHLKNLGDENIIQGLKQALLASLLRIIDDSPQLVSYAII